MNVLKQVGTTFMSLILAGCLSSNIAAQTPADDDMRGAWIATVSRIDWPSNNNPEDQRQELVDMLDTLQSNSVNTVILQIRAECDAFYPSTIEPWSRWLTGSQGTAPTRAWDPLQFAIDECRRRGMELHAWMNPYRAGTNRAASFDSTHVSVDMPQIVEEHSTNFYWLNPGHPDTIPYILSVISDVVSRYDIDALHFDDYFYPSGVQASFDSTEFSLYNGGLSLANWRRSNTNNLIAQIDSTIASLPGKSHVRFGISPSGIWVSGQPPTTNGMSAYNDLYADTRKWLRDGTLDYLAPQIYWGLQEDGHPAAQDFDKILDWWSDTSSGGQNPLGRPLFAGIPAYKGLQAPAGADIQWEPGHVLNLVNYQVSQSGNKGSIFYSAKHLTQNSGQGIGNGTVGYLANMLNAGPYVKKATSPAYTHMDSTPPSEPTLAWEGSPGLGYTVHWAWQGTEYPQWYTVYWYDGAEWSHDVVPDWQREYDVPGTTTHVAVQALDRSANRSSMTSTALSGTSPAVPAQISSTTFINQDSLLLDFANGSGSNRNVTPSADVMSDEETNNRVDPRVSSPGSQSRKVPFTWTGSSSGFYRLSTNGPDPMVDLTKGLGVYIKVLSGELKVCVGIRETGGVGPIGADGGGTGAIEVTSTRTVTASNNWQYLYYNLPEEVYSGFTGNGTLDGNWGVFEGLYIYQVDGAPLSYTIYIDEIHQGDEHTPLGEPVPVRSMAGSCGPGTSIELAWQPSAAQDLAKYRVYRSDTPGVTATTSNLLVEVTSPEYLDLTTAYRAGYYYAVTAVDHFGYESKISDEFNFISCPVSISGFQLE